MRILEGNYSAKGSKVAIVASRFNEFITSELFGGAVDCLKRHELEEENITVCWVLGAFEIPLFAQKLANTQNYDGIYMSWSSNKR